MLVVQGQGLFLKMETPYIGEFLSHKLSVVKFDL